jgi:signal transduction histidine kinase/ActR/RegA family two-component response regulator
VDSITAPPSSASSPVDGLAAEYAEVFQLVARLSNPNERLATARLLAAIAGAENLVVFVVDVEIGVLLPAPGFPQTLPDAKRWKEFLARLSPGATLAGTLPYPDSATEGAALGISASQSALILLGGQPSAAIAQAIGIVLPVLAVALQGEQALLAARGYEALSRNAAGEAKVLATSLEKARRALQVALAAAEGANRAKDQFLAVLSHELRTPLGPVLTTATALLADETLPRHLREPIEMIRRNADLEARLIDDLLDLTRVAKGKMPLSFSSIDAHTSVRHTLEICRSDIYRRKLQVRLDLNADRHHIHADPVRFQQVLWNLIKNAVKFTPDGGHIQIRSANKGQQIEIDVSDTGMGIDAAHLVTIFDAFEQTSDSVTRRFGGLGLGLAITKALVEAQGGSIQATSMGIGKGAAFSIVFAVVPHPGGPAEKTGAIVAEKERALSLLLVEDNGDTSAMMARLLRRLGHKVATAQSVAMALEVASEHSFDLLLSDLGLPDGSGLDLMREMRKRHGLPGVAISGYGMEDDLRQTREAGFIAHLTKPLSFNQLQAVLTQFAATHGADDSIPA